MGRPPANCHAADEIEQHHPILVDAYKKVFHIGFLVNALEQRTYQIGLLRWYVAINAKLIATIEPIVPIC